MRSRSLITLLLLWMALPLAVAKGEAEQSAPLFEMAAGPVLPALLAIPASALAEPPPLEPPPPLVFPDLPPLLETPLSPMVAEPFASIWGEPAITSPDKPAARSTPPPPAIRAEAVPGRQVPAAPVAVSSPAVAAKPVEPAVPVPPPSPPAEIPPATAGPAPLPAEALTETVSVIRPEPVGVEPPPAPTPPPSQEPMIEGEVPAIIAQPDIPQELRPPGVPIARPGRLPSAPPPVSMDDPLIAKLPDKIGRTQKPAPLLPEPDQDPEIVYVVPFITLMVPDAVRERVFDEFVDTLNQTGANRKLRFVILKESLDKIDRDWLNARKYVFGEIYGYVEDSGCCATDLRAKSRLTYYRAHHPEPSLRYEYPIRTFFDHDRSTIEIERQKLSDQIARALIAEFTKALQP